MPRYRLDIEYDGSAYAGWQRQAGQHSVQAAIEQAINGFCGEDVTIRGAGRTDAGVHASGQVAHVDLARDWPADTVRDAVNAHLQMAAETVSVLAASSGRRRFRRALLGGRRGTISIASSTAARRWRWKRSKAWWVARPLDAEAMHAAAQALVGRHDFTTFRSVHCQAKSPVKTLDRLDVATEWRGDRNPRLGALVPAQPGPLDGRLAEAGRRRRLDRGRSRRRAGRQPTAPPAAPWRRRTGSIS